jgi:hypothetical protein
MKNSGAGACDATRSDADLGALDLQARYEDWKSAYADAVGISRWREL